ncbi:MAG: sigma-70 family RNA polymerase sigma factor [Cyclobacteriaceae bacterium]|jgi:RNA polymerase sigma-70 factor (ECF subfamily)|nr:sigma-70 family RNA polymerase sigma factor [Cyclobacteriaceae bacterium]
MQIPVSLYDELKRFVYSRVKNKADAEDIVHDVFLKVQTHGNQLRESAKFTSWIYQITRHSIVDHFRGKRTMMPLPAEISEKDDYHFFNECMAQCLSNLIATLPEPYREALILTEQRQMSQKELAFALGMSYSGAKTRVQRARTRLREKISALYKITTDRYGNVIECEDRGPAVATRRHA